MKPRGPAEVSFLGRLDPSRSAELRGGCPAYGRDPVGKGHAAAGFSAGRAPVLPASDGAAGAGAVGSAVLAVGVAAFIAFFFFPAFFFFLADFFAAAFLLPVFLNALFFFRDAFFFFFFLPPFFAFFFAMLYSFKVVEQRSPGA